MASYVSVNTKYFKYEQARAALDHAFHLRNGFTCSHNVIEHLTKDNAGYYYHGAKSGVDALDIMYEKYKQTTGRSCRSDFNCLFEHIVIFSEEHFSSLERKYGKEKLKEAMVHQLKVYAEKIKMEFGFEPMSIDLHLDEGFFDPLTGKITRNSHCHVSFFNRDFANKISPLRGLMAIGKSINGRTNSINLHFSKMQDIAAQVFGHEKLGFKRGISKDITSREHLSKEAFVKSKLQKQELESERIKQANANLLIQLNQSKSANEALKRDIHDKAIVLERLESQVSNIKGQLKSLEKAIKSKCKKIMKRIALRMIKQNTPSTSVNRR
jgi:hypothetical protein